MDNNFEILIEKYDHLIDSEYKENRSGRTYTFFGLVWGSDDFYYGLYEHHSCAVMLLSCVGDLEDFGYTKL